MEAYLARTQDLSRQFSEFELTRTPRGENTSADSLAALASTSDPNLKRVILVEFIEKPNIEVSSENNILMAREVEARKVHSPSHTINKQKIASRPSMDATLNK